MKRIHRFSDFSAIYEQTTVPPTDQSRVYDGTLNQILTSILNTYISTVLYPVQDYSPKIPEDIKFVELAPVERKVERFKEITERVRKAAEDNKDSKAQEVLKAWIEANSKSIEALEAIISRYQDTPADLDYMGKVINARLNEYLKELEEQAKRAQKNESVFLDLGGEGFLFEGKKRTMDDIETQVSIVNAKLASLALSLDKIPGAAAKVTALQNEVTRISQRIGELRGKKRRDIDKEELERIETRLAEIPTEMESITKDAAKQDTVNKDIAAILIEALELTAKADKLEQEYKKAKQEVQAQAQAQARTQAVKISKTIYYNSSKIGEKNEDVQKVQKVIMDRFGPVKKISDLPQYKEFSRFGADGKFGPRTQKMIKILQKGLGYDELTGNITPKFLERIQTEKILESYSSPRTIYRFSDFKGLFEDFDVNAAVEYASSQAEDPVPSSAGSTPYVANTNNPSGSSTITPPPGDLKVQPQVAAEALGVDSYDKFKSLSRDKKWQWLLEAFKEGANYKVRKSEVGVQQDTSSTIFTIFWKKEELSSDGNEIATVCWYPTNDKVPGKYVDYTPDSPKAGAWGKIEDGDWGYKIDGNSNFKVTWNLKTNLKKNNEALDWIVKNKGAMLEKDYDATIDSIVDHGDKRLLRVHLFPTSSKGSKSLTGLFKGSLSERGYYPASSEKVFSGDNKKSATLAFFSDGTVDIIYTVKLPSYGGFGYGTPTKVVTRAKWKKTTTGNLNISWYDKAAEKQKDITI